MVLVKIDNLGNHVWNKTYGGSDSETVNSMLVTGDGGYALVGYTSSFGAGDRDGWLLKIDSVGNLLWNQTYGGIGFDSINSLQIGEQGEYLLSGFSTSEGEVDTDMLLIKFAKDGLIPEFVFPVGYVVGGIVAVICGVLLVFFLRRK